jgi:hypothetical protein
MKNDVPAPRALAVLDQPAPTEPVKPLRITDKVRRAIDLMVSGSTKTISAAAEQVGMHHDSLSRALSKPHVTEFLRQRVLRHLAIAAARAGAVKGELLDSDNEMVRDRASSFVLGLAGIQPATSPSINLNIEAKAGFVIDLSPEPGEIIDQPSALRVVSP